jgi:hypothetical protein
MDEPVKKLVDESWKEQAEREKRTPGPAEPKTSPTTAPGAPGSRPETEELPQARFDLFVSGLVMEALIAMGDVPNPTTRKQSVQLSQAKYLIDLLGVLEERTKGNLSVEEDKLLKDALYQLRMRYLSKAGGP